MNGLRFTIAGLIIILCLTPGASVNFGQTTVFTYQGKLTDSGTAATATDAMVFRLFNDPASSQIGSSINNPTVIGDIQEKNRRIFQRHFQPPVFIVNLHNAKRMAVKRIRVN